MRLTPTVYANTFSVGMDDSGSTVMGSPTVTATKGAVSLISIASTPYSVVEIIRVVASVEASLFIFTSLAPSLGP